MSEGTQSQEQAASAAEKTKKINKLSADKISKKIAELESKNQISSKYYEQLKLRLAELNK